MSFLMNASSSFEGIRAFGIFATCLVTCNYASMVLFWPTVVILNYHSFAQKRFLCGCLDAANRFFENTSIEAKETSENQIDSATGRAESVASAPKKPILVVFFEQHFSHFILAHRVKVICVFLAISGGLLSQVPNLVPEKEAPSMLPAKHPLNQYLQTLRGHFLRGGGQFNTKVSLVFGFDKDPLDKEGTDPSGAGFGDTGVGSLGRVRWNPRWYRDTAQTESDPAIFKGFNCFVQLCDSAEEPSTDRHTGGPPAYPMSGCFARDVKRWLLSKSQNRSEVYATWDLMTSGSQEGAQVFMNTVRSMVKENPGYQQELQRSIYAEDDEGKPLFRFFKTEITLTSDKFMDSSDGIQMSKNWEAWLAAEMSKGACLATSEMFHGFIQASSFTAFQKSDTILGEMFQGLALSMLVALLVLISATGNIFIGLYAGLCIAMIVMWVMSMVPLNGWELGMVENICLVMVPGLSVDYVAHMAEAYNGVKYNDREHRVVHMLEHSAVSVVSGSISTLLAAGCLFLCDVTFFTKFGAFVLFTIIFSLSWALFFFPSLLALIGPTGSTGDFHRYIHPKLQRENSGEKQLRVKPCTSTSTDSTAGPEASSKPKCVEELDA
eukprot:gnl/TRDRNA2_/TRDRNA2_153488_c0_seq1.p1 gnl/TRDRNA2_/TRDRNA2_153488_c0~~gnl/TRDRNA2_/TRDRNA2_153488_c0_seq1.p1  ORF type:complete len:658 (+),score=89.13 gnl/TRDRNA2_/TRDRNA2_153488_c0_seq1:156-1976(+)